MRYTFSYRTCRTCNGTKHHPTMVNSVPQPCNTCFNGTTVTWTRPRQTLLGRISQR